MIKSLPLLFMLALSAVPLSAQAEGDLMPRSGTLAYMVSDTPDIFYRLFGKDSKGAWKLRSFAKTMMEKKIEDPESEEAQKVSEVHDYIFGSYEQLSKVEMGLIDVTLDGPKYLLVMHTKAGNGIDAAPEFLSEFKEGSETYRDITFVKYRAGAPEDSTTLGMDRFYVAQTSTGLLVSNFESTIRDAIDKLVDKTTDDSLSGRKEFTEWVGKRGKHDFSMFVIGREIQNMIERLIPSEEQAGEDYKGAYEDLDAWLNMREYKYIVFNGDYDEVARGITVSAEFRTRRQTPMLEKLSIAPAEFKLLKFVPANAVVRGGIQLGDAKKTFENLRAFANDMAESLEMLTKRETDGRDEDWEDSKRPDDPKEDTKESSDEKKVDEKKKEDVKPSSDDDWLPKSFVLPLKDILNGQDMGGEEIPTLPEAEGEGEEVNKIEHALEKFDEMLGEYGTSRDEILAVLGSEIIVFMTTDRERALAASGDGFQNAFESGSVGIIVGIKDATKLKSIIANAREADPEGAFQGFEEVGYQGFMFNVSEERPFGYCITGNALLVSVPMGVKDENPAPAVIAGLQAMTEASTRTTTGNDTFVSNSSKFLEVDLGSLFRLGAEIDKAASEALDRHAQPSFSDNPLANITDLVISYRQKEFKDGAEVSMRVTGLPDFGKLLDSVPTGGSDDDSYTDQNAYSYGEGNLNLVMDALTEHVNSSEEKIDLDALIESKALRAGALQSPFDKQWKGDISILQWTTLSQVRRNKEGELDEWVDEDAAVMIEENERAGWRSFKLNEGDIESWIRDYKTGFIVAYQEKPDSMNGHLVLYANGSTGWLHQNVFAKALALNKAGEPVPAKDAWDAYPEKDGAEAWPEEKRESMPESAPDSPDEK
ncbi:hypothetical protein OAU50_05435 [Planctomycetota bacterium]|nr:hypothetical protein [Planctomycetota bacterium]